MSNSIYTVQSPVMGIYYSAAGPDAEPFVNPGDHVKAGEVVCVIESMKIFTNIKTAQSGVVKQILVGNEEMVMKNQALIEIKVTEAG